MDNNTGINKLVKSPEEYQAGVPDEEGFVIDSPVAASPHGMTPGVPDEEGFILEEQPVEKKPPSLGRVGIPRETRAGVFATTLPKELDNLFSGRESLDSVLPPDVVSDLGDIISVSADPQTAKDNLESSIIYSVALDMPLEQTHSIIDELNMMSIRDKGSSANKRIKGMYVAGKAQQEQFKIVSEFGLLSYPFNWENIDKVVGELDKLQNVVESNQDPGQPWRGFWEKNFSAASEQIPIQIETIKATGKWGTYGALMFGLGALVLGGPSGEEPGAALLGAKIGVGAQQAAIQAAALLGFKTGGTLGAVGSMYRMEAAGHMLDLYRTKDSAGNRVDPKLAFISSHIVGTLNAPVEFASTVVFLKTLGVAPTTWTKAANIATKKLMKDGVIKGALLVAAAKLGTVNATEVGEELFQTSTDQGLKYMVIELNKAWKGTDHKQVTVEELRSIYLETIDKTLRATSIIAAPGVGVNVMVQGLNVQAQIKDDIERKRPIRIYRRKLGNQPIQTIVERQTTKKLPEGETFIENQIEPGLIERLTNKPIKKDVEITEDGTEIEQPKDFTQHLSVESREVLKELEDAREAGLVTDEEASKIVDEFKVLAEEGRKAAETPIKAPETAVAGQTQAEATVTPAEAKQPWEMTSDELANVPDGWYKGKQHLIPLNKFKEIGINRNYVKKPDGYYHVLGSGNIGAKVTETELARSRNESIESHRYYVEKALKEGKPVPAEVLAEYPELSKPTPAEVTVTPEGKLIEEAKKYKTADEFVQSQGETVYHNTLSTAEFTEIEPQTQKLFSGEDASKYKVSFFSAEKPHVHGRFKPRTIEAKIQLNNPWDYRNKDHVEALATHLANIGVKNHNLETLTKSLSSGDWSVIEKQGGIDWIKENGFDGFIIRESPTTPLTYGVFDKSQIKTISQLTDIWNKAAPTPAEATVTPEGKVKAFHVTKSQFDDFKPTDMGTVKGESQQHGWYYFAKDKKWSENFAKEEPTLKSEKTYIREQELIVEKPLDITESGSLTVSQWRAHLESKGVVLPESYWEAKLQGEKNEGFVPDKKTWAFWQMTRNDTGVMRKAILDAGYDSLIMPDVARGKSENITYVVFDKSQISKPTPAEAKGKGEVSISETILGGGGIGLDIKKDGKLIAEMTFSINEEGIAKIGFIKAFGGRGSLSIADLKEAQRQAKEKFPTITKFTGDRVTKEAVSTPPKAEGKGEVEDEIARLIQEQSEEDIVLGEGKKALSPDALSFLEETKREMAQKAKATPPEKRYYTSVPDEWRGETDLYDRGGGKLKAKGNRTIGKRKSFIWESSFDKLPVRLKGMKSILAAIKKRTVEVFKVHNTGKGNEDYYLVPPRVMEEVKAELGAEAFKQNPIGERSENQLLNDAINSLKRRGHDDSEIGAWLERQAEDPSVTLTPNMKKYIEVLNNDPHAESIRDDLRGRVEQKVEATHQEEIDERRAIQEADKETATEVIGDFLEDLLEKEQPTDMFGNEVRPDLKGGATGEQTEMFDKRSFLTRQEKDRINAGGDVKGQLTFESDPTIPDKPEGPSGFAGVAGRPKGKTEKPWLDDEKVKSPDEDMESFFQRTDKFGPEKASSLLDKTKAAYKERFELTPYVPNVPENALIKDIIRTMPEAKRAAINQAYREYRDVLDGDGSTEVLSMTGMGVYRRKIFVEEFLVEAKAGRKVPGDFTIEQLENEKLRVDDLLDRVPSIKRAYEARKALWNMVSEDLADRGVISAENAKNPHYVRHFVLHYMENERKGFGGSKKKLKQPFRTYGLQRTGKSIADVSTDILEVDTHALSQIYADNAVEDAAQEIASKYSERPKFTELAKDKNFENLVGGPKNVAKIYELRDEIADMRQQKLDKDEREILKSLVEELHELDPTWEYRQRIAISMKKLKDALGVDESYDVSFSEMSAIIREDPSSPAAMAARGIFKATNERAQFIRAALGDNFITPEKLGEANDFVEWWYKRPNVWYRATTLDGAKIAQMLEATAEADLDITIPKAMLRGALVMGKKRQGWIIPKWLAEQLDDLPVNKRSGYVVDSLTKPFVMFNKRWLIRANPARYNRRNTVGDFERLNASGRTHAVVRSWEAIQMLWNQEGEIYEMAQRHGVIGTSLWHEVGEAHKNELFSRFKKAKDLTTFMKATAVPRLMLRGISAVGDTIQDLTQAREDILRLAVFLDALEDVDNFRAGKDTRYGPHIRHWAGWAHDIEAIAKEDKWRAAARISRETMMDYGDFTPWENDVLRQGLVPFYSFQKKNAQFWPHAMKEAAKEGKAGKPIGAAARLATFNLGKWSMRVFGAYAVAYLWNHRNDEEAAKDDALPEWQRSRPHLNVGDGTFWEQTALSDFSEWFGYDDIVGDLQRFENGYIDFNTLIKDTAISMAKAPANKIYQGLSPFLKAPVTALGQKTFPDVFKPRTFAEAFSSKALEEAFLDLLGNDVRKFVYASEGKVTVKEAIAYYLIGSMYRDTSPEEMNKQIKTALSYTMLKSKSPTTGRLPGQAKSGREREHEILRARQKSLKEMKEN